MAATGSSDVPTTDGKLPIIDLNALLSFDASNEESKAAYAAECQKVADALHKFSILIVRDPRVSQEDNNKCVMRTSISAPFARQGNVVLTAGFWTCWRSISSNRSQR